MAMMQRLRGGIPDLPGQFGQAPELAAPGLEKNVAARLQQAPTGALELFGAQVPRGTDQKVNPNARMAVPMRQQLAQAMMPQREQQWRERGSGSYGTSGPQRGGSGGSGWGRNSGGQRSTAGGKGGLY